MSSGPSSSAAMPLRPLEPRHYAAVARLVNADGLPGQPTCTPEMVQRAARGTSTVDSSWWDELQDVQVEVVEDPSGTVRGAASWATRPPHTGVITWLHGREDTLVVAALLDRALDQLDHCAEIEAFPFATALSGGAGLEALPIRARPITDSTLRSRGFMGKNLWRYMGRSLPAIHIPRVPNGLIVEQTDHHQWTLRIENADKTVATAVIGVIEDNIGVLWWLHVEEDARGQGLGRRLLGSVLDLLWDLGVTQAILYVDDDEPGGDRDRRAANHLYDSTGFIEIDRLYSYLYSGRRTEALTDADTEQTEHADTQNHRIAYPAATGEL